MSDSVCILELQKEGKPHPRTCPTCISLKGKCVNGLSESDAGDITRLSQLLGKTNEAIEEHKNTKSAFLTFDSSLIELQKLQLMDNSAVKELLVNQRYALIDAISKRLDDSDDRPRSE